MSSDLARTAAQYVRMSTDMQQYSIENQLHAISAYALQRGLSIVRTYEDGARSGLVMDGRKGLQSLIEDVQGGTADFRNVLVYDVSRWGRFQDCDESAYYEYACRRSGVEVHYCAEQFENDGSLIANILKNIKRAMAAEYSRELSVKVHAGLCRVASKGFVAGSAGGYGLRRFLVDENRNPKGPLRKGEWKAIKNDRVILVPGPQEELVTIKHVYDLFLQKKYSMLGIARSLNEQGLKTLKGNDWSGLDVREILAHEKYVGSAVYNRGSRKLKGKWKRNPRTEWVVVPNAFEPVVSIDQYADAQARLLAITTAYTDADLLNYLSAIWCAKGSLSNRVIERTPDAPAVSTYKKRFGTLMKAYRKIGYRNPFIANRDRNSDIRREICDEMIRNVTARGGRARMYPGGGYRVRINEELTAAIVVGRTAPSVRFTGQNRWRFSYRTQQKPEILVVARVKDDNRILDYFVLPFLFLCPDTWLTLSGLNYRRLEEFRYERLNPLYDAWTREPLLDCDG